MVLQDRTASSQYLSINGEKKVKKNFGFSECIEVFLIILCAVSPLVPTAVKYFIYLAVAFFNFKTTIKIDRMSIIVICLSTVVPLFISVFTPDTIVSAVANYGQMFIKFVVAYIMAQKYSLNLFLKIFEKIVFVLAIMSLAGYLIVTISPNLIYQLPTYKMNGISHYTAYVVNFLMSDGKWLVIRNSGIAWEPGVFQLMLNISVAYMLVSEKKVSFIKLIVYCFTIYTTKSTVGLILLLIMILVSVKRVKWMKYVLAVVFVLSGSYIYAELQNQIDKMNSAAATVRIEPTINAIKYSWYRFFGIGYSTYISKYRELDIGSFDTYTQQLMIYGYPMLIFSLVAYFKMFKYNALLAIVIILSMIGEPLGTSVFILMMCFMVYDKNIADNELNR